MTTHPINADFELTHQSEFFSLFYNAPLDLALCVAEEDYIPIANFKKMFQDISLLMATKTIKHLIFDKRKLRTFHQPSMEWYFAIWKVNVKEQGLVSHFKILPDLPWFKKAVEAGKQEIYNKYGTNILKGITVRYADSVEDAITLVKNDRR